jgi:rhodanese-related sulfurtransferase
MSSKKRSRAATRGSSGRPGSTSGARGPAASESAESVFAAPTSTAGRLALLVGVLVLIAVVVIAADFLFGAISGGNGSAAPATSSPTATSAAPATSSQIGVVVQGKGGHWTNVTADQLAGMLTHKDFTLVNVKTPYIGEIDGTDLYIPYDQLAAKASALPGNKGARILVYCRSGAESAIAAQTLLDLGYTNVWNLDGGMNAWQASGRTLVQKNR